jgi:hypothetical protein
LAPPPIKLRPVPDITLLKPPAIVFAVGAPKPGHEHPPAQLKIPPPITDTQPEAVLKYPPLTVE